MKGILQGVVGAVALTIGISIFSVSAAADTCVYVGRDASTDGTTIIARSIDDITRKSSGIYVEERVTNQESRVIAQTNGFSYELPNTTFKYQIVKPLSENGISACSADVTMNEYGLTVTAVGLDTCDEKNCEDDPYIEEGISNDVVAEIIGASCKDVESAVDLLAEIIDENGSQSGMIVVVADQDEARYVEVSSGHQYETVELPQDKAVVFGEGNNIDKSLYSPKEKISLEDVLAIVRDYDIAKVDEQCASSEAFAVQILNNVPAKMADIMWLNLGGKYSPFLPVSNMVESVPASYSKDKADSDCQDDVAAYSYNRVSSLCEKLGPDYYEGIREYWEGMEYLYMSRVHNNVKCDWADAYDESPDNARAMITEFSSNIMNDSLITANDIFDDLICNITESGNEPYTYDFDLESYAKELGWEVECSDNTFVAIKDGRCITIEYDEDGNGQVSIGEVDNTDVPADESDEEIVEVLLENAESAAIIKEKVKELDRNSIEEKIISSEEAVVRLREFEKSLIEIIEEYYGKAVDELTIDDLSKELSVREVLLLYDSLSELEEDSIKLVEAYFDESIEEIVATIADSNITESELTGYIDELREKAVNLVGDAITEGLTDVYGVDINKEELIGFADTLTTGVRSGIEEYFGKDISDITEDDVLDALCALDDEAKEAIGELFGVDFDEAIKAYRNSEINVDIDVNVPKDIVEIIKETPIAAEPVTELKALPIVEEQIETAVDEPITVEEPVVVQEEPVIVEEPVVVPEEPVTIEEPVVIQEETAVVENSVEVQAEVVVVEEPIIDQAELNAEDESVVAVIEEPVAVMVEESVVEEQTVSEVEEQTVSELEVQTPVTENIVIEAENHSQNTEEGKVKTQLVSEKNKNSENGENIFVKIKLKNKKVYAPSSVMRYFR